MGAVKAFLSTPSDPLCFCREAHMLLFGPFTDNYLAVLHSAPNLEVMQFNTVQ